jgi:hypothetical protein
MRRRRRRMRRGGGSLYPVFNNMLALGCSSGKVYFIHFFVI